MAVSRRKAKPDHLLTASPEASQLVIPASNEKLRCNSKHETEEQDRVLLTVALRIDGTVAKA
jgi:hypothetical protein